MKDILLISATRKIAAEFEKSSPLSGSIAKLQTGSKRVTTHVAYENHEGLSTVYNRFLNAEYAKSFVVFVHDDVSIEDLFFAEKLDQAFQSFDVIGLAGNQRPDPEHLSWFDLRQPLRRAPDSSSGGDVGPSKFGSQFIWSNAGCLCFA